MDSAFDSLFDSAARLTVEMQIGSVSLIQRRLRVSYNRAVHVMLQLENAGIVGPLKGVIPREVLIKSIEELQAIIERHPPDRE